jgi:hypothetical protein
MNRTELMPMLFIATFLTFCMQRAGVEVLANTGADNGLIEGTVSYENGSPVNGAIVYASLMSRPIKGIIPHSTTDDTGHFAIHHLSLGKYAVDAEKLGEDYPNMSMQFYSDGKFETVTLTSRRLAATVSIRLGPKAGVLVGTVSDAVTGAPLNPCAEFRRAKGPDNYLSGTGLVKAKYRVLVPSNTDVLLKVWHEGYKPWYYPGTLDKAQSRTVNLKPGEEMKLDIRLQPDRDALPGGCGMPVGTVIQP